MSNNTYRTNARKFLNALDNPKRLATVRLIMALGCVGVAVGLLGAQRYLWAVLAMGLGLWLLWRAQVARTPKLKVADIAISDDNPPELYED